MAQDGEDDLQDAASERQDAIWKASLRALGRLGAVLGPSWGRRVAVLGCLGAVLGRLGAVLGPSGRCLGADLGLLGRSWCPRWSQNRKKLDLKIDQKMMHSKIDF